MQRHLVHLVLLAACGGSAPAPSTPAAPAAEPIVEPAADPAATSTTGDPSTHRKATIVAAPSPPASLWRDDAGEGALSTAPSAAPDRISIALTATAACDRKAACTYYEHAIPAGQARAASLAWREYGPDRRVATLWGDPASGPAGVLVEVKAGSAAFWHMHRHDVRIVVLAGTVEYMESGQPMHTLAPGSYVLQPRGYKHTESCKLGADCVLYMHGDRGVDVKAL
jgi:hypothetical protein